jgi:hypothetical protein
MRLDGGKIMKSATAFLTACLILSAVVSAEAQNGRGFRNGGQNCGACCLRYDESYPAQQLGADEAAWILFMREEEKLAMDVYQALSQKWNLRIFSNIAAAEQRHYDAIGTLIIRHNLADTALPTPGSFTNAELQMLYNDLLAKGQRSLVDALQAGVIIEERDIADLKEAISTTDKRDLLTIYGNLKNGSLNHLSAFNRRLQTKNGE